MKDIITLGIESSCDETSVAVVKNGREVLSNVINSQIKIHEQFGGVVPEIASRNHVEAISEVTKQAFFEGIKYAKKGNRIGDVSHAIGEYVKSQGYSVVREFEGHGIGRDMHEEPEIPNYGKAGRGIRLEPGMTLAIEPMVAAGSAEICEGEDGWSIWTIDESLSAHYENTILITENEPEILTII